MYFGLLIALFFGIIWLGIVVVLRRKDRKSLVYLAYFTVFYIYFYKVLDYTLFQFQSLIILRYFNPNLILRGESATKQINLVPLLTLTPKDAKTSLLNILLLVPFGFGLPFITHYRMKQVVVRGMLFSIAIELLQLISGLMAGITFRVADINDVIFNTAGAAIGYMLFVGFVRFYRRASRNWKMSSNPMLLYIAQRPQVAKRLPAASPVAEQRKHPA